MAAIELFKKHFWSSILVTLSCMTDTVGAATVHGTDGEKQVVGEMKVRLSNALATEDVGACQREGENLARYGNAEQGVALIEQDKVAVQRRLDAIKLVYESYYELRTLNNKKSVKQAFKLISQLQDKLTEDALHPVAMVFVPAHTVSSKIALELYIAARDVNANSSEAGELVNSANALKDLDRLVRDSDQKMQKMIPEAKNLEQIRTFLIACHSAYREGASSSKPSATSASQQPTLTPINPRGTGPTPMVRVMDVNGTWTAFGASDGGSSVVRITTNGEKFHATSSYTNQGKSFSWTMDGTIDPRGKVEAVLLHSAATERKHYTFQLSTDGKKFSGADVNWVRR